jgi:uncharacterized protein (TIGR00290 family)
MPYALMTSGGKDAVLALDRLRRDGADVRYAVTLYDRDAERVRFHGVRMTLIRAQAAVLDLECIAVPTSVADYEQDFLTTLDELASRGVDGVVFGNVHLADVRGWYAERTAARKLEQIEPLWGTPPIEVAWEVVERGYRTLITSVDPAREAAPYLGREFDADVVTGLGTTDDVDPCGEAGEFHTFVFEGPELRDPVSFDRGNYLDIEGYRVLDLVPPNGAG